MRKRVEVMADFAAMRRPVHPASAGIFNPQAIAKWSAEMAAWRAATPDADARWQALLDEDEALDKAQAKARAAQHRIQDVRIPKGVLSALVEPKPTRPFVDALAWCAAPKQYLALAGNVGTGKTVAAGAALVRLMEGGASGAWLSAGAVTSNHGGFAG